MRSATDGEDFLVQLQLMVMATFNLFTLRVINPQNVASSSPFPGDTSQGSPLSQGNSGDHGMSPSPTVNLLVPLPRPSSTLGRLGMAGKDPDMEQATSHFRHTG